MREVNFSIPNVNKASVGITTALYDRRALDCTSTLPLINSLNHLAYLTTSSARIRDILTVDGGVERLICILKEGRGKDMMEMWKWNLAFQCVVNIGVRGSESVRTRVVEADMVPVIATILDNYIKVIDPYREKCEKEHRGSRAGSQHKQHSRSREHGNASFSHRPDRGTSHSEHRQFRRQAPPPSIEIPPSSQNEQAPETEAMDISSTPPAHALTSPPERTTFSRHHHHHRSHDERHRIHPSLITTGSRSSSSRAPATAVPSIEMSDAFGLRPVRDSDRLPSMLPALQTGITSQPDSPTTPSAPPQVRPSAPMNRQRRRPSIRHQVSMSGDSDDPNADGMASDESAEAENSRDHMVDLDNSLVMQGFQERADVLDGVSSPLSLTAANGSEGQDSEGFNLTNHRAVVEMSMVNAPENHTNPSMALSPTPGPVSPVNPHGASTNQALYHRLVMDRPPLPPSVMALLPRDEDVLMSLQLLAYVSKYCNLRSYFQKSHLVPKLQISRELQILEEGGANCQLADNADEEYLVPDDFNIFPLVEKFTVRHHTTDMQYWAGVVMRNLCRKDDSRGGIRQCAHYQCGKWEEYTRQFAKCRRCRRTKYCSKECQKSAWVYHRHWCVAAQP
ncbi:hypothetical protein L228DRAFT_15165 [Xylona heveae TC161]|uniref:MYND-type zinc finger protein samB n=1 Tax=Xylona heveae (strain CBS 132557 / TC161) TaxID=1328760 RepID=A0A165JSS0_XYLHT|nr:hypothetical protein L228DRAFT_15165 [Xylona heveae TC161]KZF26577.1 hypothetical protein L228DRAFT_15165 [Xylona heveae TC161]